MLFYRKGKRITLCIFICMSGIIVVFIMVVWILEVRVISDYGLRVKDFG